MARYIDADALINEIMTEWGGDPKYFESDDDPSVVISAYGDVWTLERISKALTADVVEVVRCKDCKWFDRTNPYGTLSPNAFHCNCNERFFRDDFYCGYGERREK